MASLIAHLRQSEEHGRLTFHAECPICRAERLSGALPSHGIVSRRAQAAVLAGVLAASTAAPTVASAQEQDQVKEGAVAPEQAGDDPALSPDFDPGGESDDLPFDAADGPESEAAPDPETGDPGPVEQEPVTDIDAPVADAGDEPAQPVAAAPSPTPTVTPAPSPAAPEADAPEVSAPEADPTTGAATPDAEPGTGTKAEGGRKPRDRSRHDPKPDVERPVPTVPSPAVNEGPSAPTQPAVIQVAQAALAPQVVVDRTASAKPGDRFHVVLPGESLWSIARALLGSDASTASVAREVNRLWELNKTRIATGDPDLLRIGTRLSLR